MKAFNKVGFHTSVGGNPTGIGDWMRALDAADIPFFVKAADAMTGLFDAQQIVRARGGAVPHVLAYRRSIPAPDGGVPPSGNPDVPDYNKEPEAAAADHWAWHKSLLPPELDPKLVWIETINELRKEVVWADWIGKFAFHHAQMAMADGYRFSAFGYSTGTPDDGAWETDGMLQFLELCAQHPDDVSVSLHEYSLKTDDIWFLRGDHVGRFQKVFDTCDRHKIARPKVLITEWGWTHERVPAPEEAIRHIQEVGELYGRYPEILGAAIWYLGPGFGGIANLAQRLIKPVTDFTLSHTFDLPGEVPVAPPPPPPVVVEEPRVVGEANGRFIKDVTILDDTVLTAGDSYTKTWRVENSGEMAWGAGFKLLFVGGTQMHDATSLDVPATAPGEQVNISIPMHVPEAPGTHFSDWRFQDTQGRQFGDILYVRIVSQPPIVVPHGVSDAAFVADVTIPDDTQLATETAFTKTWRVRNSGTRPWGSGFRLDFIGGTNMASRNSVPLPAAAPGQTVEISIEMRAPAAPGMYFADWRMKDEHGNPFGEMVYLRIVVPSPAGASLASPLSQRDPLWAGQRLGHAGSPKTIGEWGCLLTCFAMVANTYGRAVTPAQLNHALLSRGGFIDGYLTKWNGLSNVYTDIIYHGKVEMSPALLNRIDSSLAQGNPVSVLVDFTRDTPYTDNDQHWVLIVGKDGE
ncbi:MAG: C39 family peptidase, partial [Anaerolineales bacterium]|nr:C39 family peptidase [Anaerolineales bacterium]